MKCLKLAALLTMPIACASVPDRGSALPLPTPAQAPTLTGFAPSGPQSYTPAGKEQVRSRIVSPIWSTQVGLTDHRTTMVASHGLLYVGTRDGLAVIHALTGVRRPPVPAARGHVIGVALDGDRLYSSSISGEVVGATTKGATLFRVRLGAQAATPPTLVDVDGDGALEVAVGDVTGNVSLYDGATGKRLWSKPAAEEKEVRPSIGAGLAAGDIDGDGVPEIVVGTESGTLAALRGRTGERTWRVHRDSALRAAPVLADLDGDRKLDVVAGWADGDISIVDGTGKEVWKTKVEEDDGDPTGVLASPTPLAGGTSGVLVVPTARWGDEDAVILHGRSDRLRRAEIGRVVTSPSIGVTDPEATGVEAVVGTERGEVFAIDAFGAFARLHRLSAAVTAPIMFTDADSNGTQELLVLTRDGRLTALALHAAIPPAASRARGSAHNDGVMPAVNLGWRRQ